MRIKLALMSSVAALFSLAARPVLADTLSVQNPSFEIAAPFTATCAGPESCAYNSGIIPAWSLTGTGGSFQPSSTYFHLPLPDGSTIAYSDGGTLSQTLTGTSLAPNSVYNLTVAVGQRFDENPAGFSLSAFAGSSLLGEFDGSTANFPLGSFLDQTLSFSTGDTVAPGDLSIVLGSIGDQSDFDNVRFSVNTNAPVADSVIATPEPGSFGLLASGLLCVGLFALYSKRHTLTTTAVQPS